MDDTQKKRSRRVPKPPEWMEEEAVEEWNKVAGYLTRQNRLTKENTVLLEVYCETYCKWRRIAKILVQTNIITVKTTPKGNSMEFKASPFLYPFEQFGRTVWKYAKELGLYVEPADGQLDSDGKDTETDEQIMLKLLNHEYSSGDETDTPL